MEAFCELVLAVAITMLRDKRLLKSNSPLALQGNAMSWRQAAQRH